jgi:hypothetical protein
MPEPDTTPKEAYYLDVAARDLRQAVALVGALGVSFDQRWMVAAALVLSARLDKFVEAFEENIHRAGEGV